MLGNKHFNNKTIRKMVVVFGSLFDDIELIRFDKDGVEKEIQKVPLIYGPKEKYIQRLNSDPTLNKSVSIVVPRMVFTLDGLSYDATRKQITTLQDFAMQSDSSVASQYVPVPYNYNFTLSIMIRNIEDGAQILEQILPFFTPDFTVAVDFIPSLNKKYNVPIILNTTTSTEDYEGNFDTTRLLTWDLTFTAKGFIWPPVKTSGLIRKAITNIYTFSLTPEDASNTPQVEIVVVPDPITANANDDYGYTTTITENT